jgi:hypothetical protein
VFKILHIKFKPKGYTKKEVREWLQSQDTYTLHKPIRRRFPRRRVVVYGKDHQWQADLVDVSKISSYNKRFKYLLTCIDVLSRYSFPVSKTRYFHILVFNVLLNRSTILAFVSSFYVVKK